MPSRTATRKLPASEPSEPTLELIDLSAIAEKYPVNVKRMVLDMSSFDASKLTLLEVLDMAEASGIQPERLASLLGPSSSNDPRKFRMLYALGWVIARRANPDLTFAEVITWKMDVVGKMTSAAAAKSAARNRAVVNAALLAGVTPTEAEKLTVGQLSEYRSRRRRKQC